MNTVQTWQTVSTNLSETLKLGKDVGGHLRGGEVLVLVSDLGGGKTTFVKGLAAGMGSSELVRSPSFTVANQYRSSELTLYHFDFHRLNEPGLLRDELAEILADKQSIVVIEWANIIADVLPSERLIINIKPTSQNGREFRFEYPTNLNYLFPANT